MLLALAAEDVRIRMLEIVRLRIQIGQLGFASLDGAAGTTPFLDKIDALRTFNGFHGGAGSRHRAGNDALIVGDGGALAGRVGGRQLV